MYADFFSAIRVFSVIRGCFLLKVRFDTHALGRGAKRKATLDKPRRGQLRCRNLKNQIWFSQDSFNPGEIPVMARPKARELTQRELEVMHACWRLGEPTAADVRDELERHGRDLAYTTVATLVRILCDKGFLEQTSQERPFTYRPIRSFDEVSGNLVWDLVERLFGGKREQLLVRLLDEKKLTAKERAAIEEIWREQQK